MEWWGAWNDQNKFRGLAHLSSSRKKEIGEGSLPGWTSHGCPEVGVRRVCGSLAVLAVGGGAFVASGGVA